MKKTIAAAFLLALAGTGAKRAYAWSITIPFRGQLVALGTNHETKLPYFEPIKYATVTITCLHTGESMVSTDHRGRFHGSITVTAPEAVPSVLIFANYKYRLLATVRYMGTVADFGQITGDYIKEEKPAEDDDSNP